MAKYRPENPFKERLRQQTLQGKVKRMQQQRHLTGMVEEVIQRIRLPSLAMNLIRTRDLLAIPIDRSILRLGLQKVFLEAMIEKRTGYRRLWPSKEKTCLKLAQDTEKLHTVLWDFDKKTISFKKALEMYEAAADIMRKAQSFFRKNPSYNMGKFKDMERRARANARQIKSNIAAGKRGQILQINKGDMVKAAKVGEAAIGSLANNLPEDTQIGFELIENLVKQHLGER